MSSDHLLSEVFMKNYHLMNVDSPGTHKEKALKFNTSVARGLAEIQVDVDLKHGAEVQGSREEMIDKLAVSIFEGFNDTFGKLIEKIGELHA